MKSPLSQAKHEGDSASTFPPMRWFSNAWQACRVGKINGPQIKEKEKDSCNDITNVYNNSIIPSC